MKWNFIFGLVVVIVAAIWMGGLFPQREPWQIIAGTVLFVAIAVTVLRSML